jgi:hypothetical protein
MGRARDISKVFSTGTSLATDTEVSTTYQTKAAAGLTLIGPNSIANASGTASIGASGTVSFSGIGTSGLSLNGVFNSTYTNYKVVFDGEASGQVSMRIRFRASGTDATGSNYNVQEIRAQGASIVTERYVNSTVGEFANTFTSKMAVEGIIFNPFGANSTVYMSSVVNQNEGARAYQYSGGHTLATSYDGFTLFTSSATTTGTISVYGYNK